jgi:pSer/pThr/pTyr-binding forkhead associated (FHA) protein
MKATLIVVNGAKPARVPLKLPTVIGRNHRAKLKLRASLVSRTHCELVEDDGKLFVRDLGSSNGTYVNDGRIQYRTELFTDDFLRVGPVTFRVLFDCEPEGKTETEPPEATAEPVNSDDGHGSDIPVAASSQESAIVHVEHSEDGSAVHIEEVENFLHSISGLPDSDDVGDSVFRQLDQVDENPVETDDAALKTFLKGLSTGQKDKH